MTSRQTPIIVLFCLLSVFASAQYEDISQAAGVADAGRYGGVAVGDFDADGWDDLYFSRRDGKNKLYRNLGNGTLLDASPTAGIAGDRDTRLAIWGDLNNDGYPELYLGVANAPDLLYLNNGDGTFTEISWEAGVYNPDNPFSVSMVDINRDGWLDIYVANFKSENKCYLNNGIPAGRRATDRIPTFVDYTYRSGALSRDNAMATLFFDYDNDGDPDLYLVHDGQPNKFYRNQGDGVFQEIGAAAGVAHPGFGMGADAGDVNGDGWLDLYVTNLYENALYLNKGDGTFSDISRSAGVDDYGMGWGINFLDFDNDGRLDIYVANDSYFSPYPNVLYRNNGDNTFQIVEPGGPVSSARGGYGSACFDIDLDGLVDIALTNTGAADANQLFHNRYPPGQWIGFRLEGVASNRDAVGARIEIRDDRGVRQMEEIAAGSGFASQNSLKQHFGLGAANGVDSLIIRWPSGLVQRVGRLEGGHYYHILEGADPQLFSPTVTSTGVLGPPLPAAFVSVFPNPMRDRTAVRFRLDRPVRYRLSVLDVFGREVRALAETKSPPGVYELFWDGCNDAGRPAPTGQYFIELSAEGSGSVRPLVLLR